MTKHPVEIVYSILKLEINGPIVEMVLHQSVKLSPSEVARMREPETPTLPFPGEEQFARVIARAGLEPKSDTDRVMLEMMDSLKKYAPAVYEQMRQNYPTRGIAVAMAVPQQINQPFVISVAEYETLGSPPLLSEIKFKLSC